MEIRDLGKTAIVITGEDLRNLIIAEGLHKWFGKGPDGVPEREVIELADAIVQKALPATYKEPMTGSTSYGRIGPGELFDENIARAKCEGEDTCVMDTHCHNYATCREAEGRSE